MSSNPPVERGSTGVRGAEGAGVLGVGQRERERDARVPDRQQPGRLTGGALRQQPAGERHAHAEAGEDLRRDDPAGRRSRKQRERGHARADDCAAGARPDGGGRANLRTRERRQRQHRHGRPAASRSSDQPETSSSTSRKSTAVSAADNPASATSAPAPPARATSDRAAWAGLALAVARAAPR